MFTWDYEDRLTNLSGGGVPSTNYGYNGVGSRTSKSNTLGSRTYKRNGVGVTAPVLSDTLSSSVPGVAVKSNGVTSNVLDDRLGSMKALTVSGAVTDTAEYDAFGKVTSRTGTNSTQKGFAANLGYQEDGETGYKLLGHRYYDPETGRFLSRDRAKIGKNWYGYCNNNPLKLIDQTGHEPIILPPNPGGLPDGWWQSNHGGPKRVPGGNGRYYPPGSNGSGEGLEFHPGEPGAHGEKGEDHWHKLGPDGKKEKPHLKRGDEVEVPIADDAAVPDPNFQGEPEGFWRVNNPWAWVAGTVLVGVAVALIVIAFPVAVGAAAEIGGLAFFTSGIFVAGA